jgi:hypothetical protein
LKDRNIEQADGSSVCDPAANQLRATLSTSATAAQAVDARCKRRIHPRVTAIVRARDSGAGVLGERDDTQRLSDRTDAGERVVHVGAASTRSWRVRTSEARAVPRKPLDAR